MSEEKKGKYRFALVPRDLELGKEGDKNRPKFTALALVEHLAEASPIFNGSRSTCRAADRVIAAVKDAGPGGRAKMHADDYALLIASFDKPGKFPMMWGRDGDGNVLPMPLGRSLLPLMDPFDDAPDELPDDAREAAE